MMEWIIKIALVLGAFIAMEGVAWFTHKYIMHGILWSWHKSHHKPHKGFFEKNDLFSLFFSLVAMGLIMTGAWVESLWPLAWIGIGVTLYGISYFVFHDVIVHRRYKHRWRFKSRYMRKIIRVHKVHHKHLKKDGAEAFGFLYADKKFDKLVED